MEDIEYTYVHFSTILTILTTFTHFIHLYIVVLRVTTPYL